MTVEQFNEYARYVQAVRVPLTFNYVRVYDITGRERANGPWPSVRHIAERVEDEFAEQASA